jgi:hypothetical protein
MTSLASCPQCAGFVPSRALTCPHCSTTVSSSSKGFFSSRLGRGLLTVAGGSAFSLTLMACYGTPPLPPCDLKDDVDGDGRFEEFCEPPAGHDLGVDCNDNDKTIFTGAPDAVGDGIDQNCDGVDGIAPDDAAEGEAEGEEAEGEEAEGEEIGEGEEAE